MSSITNRRCRELPSKASHSRAYNSARTSALRGPNSVELSKRVLDELHEQKRQSGVCGREPLSTRDGVRTERSYIAPSLPSQQMHAHGHKYRNGRKMRASSGGSTVSGHRTTESFYQSKENLSSGCFATATAVYRTSLRILS